MHRNTRSRIFRNAPIEPRGGQQPLAALSKTFTAGQKRRVLEAWFGRRSSASIENDQRDIEQKLSPHQYSSVMTFIFLLSISMSSVVWCFVFSSLKS